MSSILQVASPKASISTGFISKQHACWKKKRNVMCLLMLCNQLRQRVCTGARTRCPHLPPKFGEAGYSKKLARWKTPGEQRCLFIFSGNKRFRKPCKPSTLPLLQKRELFWRAVLVLEWWYVSVSDRVPHSTLLEPVAAAGFWSCACVCPPQCCCTTPLRLKGPPKTKRW